MPVENPANPRIRLDSFAEGGLGRNLFTGDVTVMRHTLKRSARGFVREKLTISTKRLRKSDNYNIA